MSPHRCYNCTVVWPPGRAVAASTSQHSATAAARASPPSKGRSQEQILACEAVVPSAPCGNPRTRAPTGRDPPLHRLSSRQQLFGRLYGATAIGDHGAQAPEHMMPPALPTECLPLGHLRLQNANADGISLETGGHAQLPAATRCRTLRHRR